MRSKIIVFVLLFTTVTAKNMKEMLTSEHTVLHPRRKSAVNTNLPTTGRSRSRGQVMNRPNVRDDEVEKFVEILISSERYLKMIETVESKMTNLDTTFRERSNHILKHLSEILTVIKAPSSGMIEQALKNVKAEMDNLKQSLTERLAHRPELRSECIVFI